MAEVEDDEGRVGAGAAARGADGEGDPALELRVGDVVQVQCYDPKGKDQGFTVYRLTAPCPAGPGGRFARCTFLFRTDQYLQWYEENAGSAGARRLRRVLHFCAEDAGFCMEEAGRDVEVTHVDRFTLVTDLATDFSPIGK